MIQEKTEILSRAVGRRKEAVAQVKIFKGSGKFLINNKPASDYFHNNSNSMLLIQTPFQILNKEQTFEKTNGQDSNNLLEENSVYKNEFFPTNFDILVKVEGGGLIGQTEAVKLAVARAVCQLDHTLDVRKSLKEKGYLTQNSKVKERRKYGLRKARKAPQYNKR